MAVLDSAGRALLELPLKGLDALPQAKLGQYLGDIEGLLSGELSPEALAGLAGKHDEADARGQAGGGGLAEPGGAAGGARAGRAGRGHGEQARRGAGRPGDGKIFLDKVAYYQVLGELEQDAGRDLAEDPRLAGVAPEIREDLEGDRRRLAREQGLSRQVAAARGRAAFSQGLAGAFTAARRGEAGPAYAREQFLELYGPREGESRWQAYQVSQAKAPAYALVRGRSQEEIAAAKAGYGGDRALLDQVEAEDAAERRRDPAGYGLAWAPGARAAYDQAGDPGEQAAILWEAQAAAGIPAPERSPWSGAAASALAEGWLAIPDGPGAAKARVDLLRQGLLSLPAEQRAAGQATLERLLAGDTRIGTTVAALEDNRLGAAYAAAGVEWQPAKETLGLVQPADSGEIASDADPRHERQEPSQVPDLAVAAWVQQELDALGIDPEDERYSAVPDTVAILAKGYDEASGRFTGTPPDAEAMRNVLRWLYVSQRSEEQRRTHPLSDREAVAISAIYAITAAAGIDPGFAAAERPLRVAAFQGLTTDATLVSNLERWSTLTEERKQAPFDLAVDIVRKAYDLPKFDVQFKPLTGKNYANWHAGSSVGELGIMTIDLDKIPATDAMDSLGTLLHEVEHAYQQTLIRDLVAGDLTASDPRYRQVELFALSQPFYSTVTDKTRFADNKNYFNDPREFHAQRALKAWAQYLQTNSFPPY